MTDEKAKRISREVYGMLNPSRSFIEQIKKNYTGIIKLNSAEVIKLYREKHGTQKPFSEKIDVDKVPIDNSN